MFKIINCENKFFQIKITALHEEQQNSTMLQLIDITETVKNYEIKQHNELLNLINATVSHEMRNPLNSICS